MLLDSEARQGSISDFGGVIIKTYRDRRNSTTFGTKETMHHVMQMVAFTL